MSNILLQHSEWGEVHKEATYSRLQSEVSTVVHYKSKVNLSNVSLSPTICLAGLCGAELFTISTGSKLSSPRDVNSGVPRLCWGKVHKTKYNFTSFHN